MSTILKTLKKLEEEKSVLDQKLDLKEMVLKDEAAHLKAVVNARHRLFLILAMLTGVLIVGGTVFFYWIPIYKVPARSSQFVTKPLAQKKTLIPKIPSRPRTFEGVPMAEIPSAEKETTGELEKAFTFFKQVVTKPLATENLASKKNTASELLFKSISAEAPSPVVSSDLQEIENLIQSTTTLAKNSPATPATDQSSYIKDVKIKGIIFFDEGNKSNHIIVTTPNNSNLKLRMGDLVQNAVLKSIHPNHVFFLYQNQLIEMGIGQ